MRTKVGFFIIVGIVFLNFEPFDDQWGFMKNADLQKSYGVMGAEDLLRKMLFPGEYANLVQRTQELNGFDQSMEDLVEEIKN